MTDLTEGALLWTPSATTIEEANLTRFRRWLAAEQGRSFVDYDDMWRWSVTEIGPFWQAIWDFCGVRASRTAAAPLAEKKMPGASWFPGARLNYAENIFARMTADRPALLYQNEGQLLVAISWESLAAQTRSLQDTLRALGVGRGDRVVAYLPNIPEAIVGLLAVTGLGAIWSSSSPDFGPRSVLDRFSQIEPKALLAVDGYAYNGTWYDRRPVVAELQAALPTLEHTILIPQGDEKEPLSDMSRTIWWGEVLERHAHDGPLIFEQVPFDHPLWVLYSSGTTGLPKPIVQGHGGILLEHLKALTLHNDLKPGDRFFWFTSTGWMMWNYLAGSLLTGCTAILYNGSPGFPSLDALWALAEAAGMTYFGLSPAFVQACQKAGIRPNRSHDLSRIRGVGSTGAPLPVTGFQWIYENIHGDLALESLSGGTDLCTAFVGGCRVKPIHAGEIQGASLGASVQAFDPAGEPIVGEVGELVITEPMPSMPLYLWNDPDGSRYLSSYFEMFPGIWRHGDWIKFNERGGCVIYGRSDSTINRRGIRMGTSEIYQAVEGLPEVLDSLVIDLEMLGRDSYMPLFVVLRPGHELTGELKQAINQRLRTDISPRHVPDDIFQVEQIPYTLSGKKMEIPIRRILLGQPIEKAANPGAMRNPESLAYFVELAGRLNA